MILLAMKVLTVWSAVALAVSFCLGAVIRTAERTQKEQVLAALFATLAGERVGR